MSYLLSKIIPNLSFFSPLPPKRTLSHCFRSLASNFKKLYSKIFISVIFVKAPSYVLNRGVQFCDSAMEQKKVWDCPNSLNNCYYISINSHSNHSVSRQHIQWNRSIIYIFVGCVGDADELGHRIYAPFHANEIWQNGWKVRITIYHVPFLWSDVWHVATLKTVSAA